MSEENKPRKGDRVRVTFEANFVSGDDSRHMVVDIADGMGPIHIGIPAWATVEVLERADDPSQDRPGSVRQDPEVPEVNRAPQRTVIAVVAARSDGARWRSVAGNYYLADEEVVGWNRLAPIPGTPAAVAREFPSDGPEPPPDVRAVTDGAVSVPYLVRFGDHWRWARSLDAPEDFAYTGGSWKDVISQMEKPVTFTEVV